MKNKTRFMTETALMVAVLVVLQAITKNAGQLVTGSCVNAVLALSLLVSSAASGFSVALISPFVAFLLGIGPVVPAVVPAIALGNAVYVLILSRLRGKEYPPVQKILVLVMAAAGKFLTLYLLVVRLLCTVLPLKQPQIAAFTTMFTWPQLITALLGGAAALAMAKVIRKALYR